MSRWIPKAEIAFANDLITASLALDPDSETRAAFQSLADTIIASALAADPTLASQVVTYAKDVVTTEVTTRDLIAGSDPRAMKRGKLSRYRVTSIIGAFRRIGFEVGRTGETFIAKLAADSDPDLRQVRAGRPKRLRVIGSFGGVRRIAFEVRPRGETFVARLSDDSDPRLLAAVSGLEAVTGVTVLGVLGQSLPSGRARPYGGGLDPVDPRIFSAEWGAGDTASKAVTGLIVAPVPLPTRDVATGLSMATVMARRILANKPPGHRVVIVNAAVGSSGLVADASTGVWRVDYTGSNPALWPGAANGIQAGMDLAFAKWGIAPDLVLTWNQGEADSGTTRPVYEAAEDALFAAARARFGATVPIIVGGMVREYALTQGREHIQAALADTPRRVERTAYARMPLNAGYSANLTDFVHPAREAVEIVGRDMADAIPRAIANVAGSVPDMPSYVSALVVGDKLTVEWSPPFSRATGYTVQRSSDGGTTWTGIPHTTGETWTAPVTVTTGPVLVRLAVTNDLGTSEFTTPVPAIGAWHA